VDGREDLDWYEDATLYIQLPVNDAPSVARAQHIGPLHWIVELALSGRCGPIGILLIETESGLVFEADAIDEMARRSDRPKSSGAPDPASGV
jgi:hypothetical protein